MPKIVFIQPQLTAVELDRNIKTIFPLGLGCLAAYVPKHWEIEIIDEQIETIDFEMAVDVVGLTTTTLTINRAYQIAEQFRKRKVTVFLGGVHASMCPEEAKAYCDAICIGDGEHLIAQMLSDYENQCLQKEYVGGRESLDGLKLPRYDLFKAGYSFIPFSTSRGCPFDCNFCAINKFYGGMYRKREDIEGIIEDLKKLPKGYDRVFFTDGNMYGYSKKDVSRFKQLCRRMAEERKKGSFPFKNFLCYASVNALADEEALDLAAEAGCLILSIGFESINPASLKDMNKIMNLKLGVESYPQLVANAQKRNILVLGEILLGNDSDDMDVLKATNAFLKTVGLDILRLQILQPLPGTKVFKLLQEEGRLHLKKFPEDWQKITDSFLMGVHYDLKNLDSLEFRRYVKQIGMEFYAPLNILHRGWKTLKMTQSIKVAGFIIELNIKSRKSYANQKL
ncbi:radical SAM protein [Deltaproteobacteria bacterium TL4]